MPKWLRTFALPVALSLVAAACGGDEGDGGTGGEPTDGAAANGADIAVGVALDVGGLGDKSFNDAAKRGLDQAIADGLVCEESTNFVEANNTGSNRDANVEALADEGFDLIIGVGFAFSEGIAGIAADYPDQNFAIVDGFANAVDETLTNVADLTFKEHEGSFLVGVAAAGDLSVRHDRVPRRAGRRWQPHREVRGRLYGRCQGGEPEHRGARRVHR